MRRLGRVPFSVVIGTAAVAAVVLVVYVCGASVFSPGALSEQNRRGTKLANVTSHAAIGDNCSACHAAPWSSQAMADRCLDCHAAVREQFDCQGPLHGNLPDGMRCRRCHTEHKGAHATITRFDSFQHDWTAFKLTGKHVAADCQSCHASQLYRGTSQACVSCHAEPAVHKGRYGTNCAQCHSTSTWGGPGFDHDLAAFKLAGKHRAVDCKSCHVNNVFAGTSQACASCHQEPAVHQGHFGTDCASCHSTATWSGSSIKHAFPLNHGRRGKVSACATCHSEPGSYKTYTCYGCHEHNPARIEKRHTKVPAAKLNDCVQCHANGREHGRGKEREAGMLFCPGDLSLLSREFMPMRSTFATDGLSCALLRP